MNQSDKREALLKLKSSPGWKDKIKKMDSKEVSALYNQMNFEGRFGEK